uniref:50S ribosomal protein L9, chloroplastic n=1 Tax=Renouxia sp. TaxID=2485823 RepID=A0A3G3MH84_9FLOR|nr:ribosomal protein L9 [Renouxia sp.]
MKKTIQIIVTHENSGLGKIGDIKAVKLGYASNYLLPNSLVEIASKGKIRHYHMLKEKELRLANHILDQALTLKNHLQTIKKISIKKKVGEHQQIFGRITEKEVIEALIKHTGKQLSKKHVEIPEIKKVGFHRITIRLTEKIYTFIILHLLPNNF